MKTSILAGIVGCIIHYFIFPDGFNDAPAVLGVVAIVILSLMIGYNFDREQ